MFPNSSAQPTVTERSVRDTIQAGKLLSDAELLFLEEKGYVEAFPNTSLSTLLGGSAFAEAIYYHNVKAFQQFISRFPETMQTTFHPGEKKGKALFKACLSRCLSLPASYPLMYEILERALVADPGKDFQEHLGFLRLLKNKLGKAGFGELLTAVKSTDSHRPYVSCMSYITGVKSAQKLISEGSGREVFNPISTIDEKKRAAIREICEPCVVAAEKAKAAAERAEASSSGVSTQRHSLFECFHMFWHRPRPERAFSEGAAPTLREPFLGGESSCRAHSINGLLE